MSAIPDEVRALAVTLKGQATRLGDLVRALKATPFADDLACEISELLVTLAGHHADLNKLQSLVGAAGMVGVMGPRRVRGVGAADLRPGDLRDLMEEGRQRELMLLSLHKAGDHSLDEEDEQDA